MGKARNQIEAWVDALTGQPGHRAYYEGGRMIVKYPRSDCERENVNFVYMTISEGKCSQTTRDKWANLKVMFPRHLAHLIGPSGERFKNAVEQLRNWWSNQ